MAISGKKMIKNLSDLYEVFGVNDFAALNRAVYKYTVCGAQISRVEQDDPMCDQCGKRVVKCKHRSEPQKRVTGVRLSAIVEGSSAEFYSEGLIFPFSLAHWRAEAKEVERLALAEWRRANPVGNLVGDKPAKIAETGTVRWLREKMKHPNDANKVVIEVQTLRKTFLVERFDVEFGHPMKIVVYLPDGYEIKPYAPGYTPEAARYEERTKSKKRKGRKS